MPRHECSGHPASLTRYPIEHLARITPSALEQRTEQGQGFGGGPRSSSRTASLAHDAAQSRGEGSVRPHDAAACTVGKGGCVARDRQGPQQVGVQDQCR